MTSAGQIARVATPPYFVLIDRVLRDEGTSYHYLPPAEFAVAEAGLADAAMAACAPLGLALHRGASWTTDAPFRETASAIEKCRARNILAVEMEAAGLYAFAASRRRQVLCFARVTNQMAMVEGDFKKGEAAGSAAALAVIAAAARGWAALTGRSAE
jgi:purine-nucleoside phosphorylase